MKLFSISTPQTETLKNDWFLKTLQDDWEINIIELENAPPGEGDYLSDGWYHCIEKKIGVLVQAIKDSWNDIIIWADIDIQFFRPCTEMVLHSMNGNDIGFQMWHKDGADANTGFMAIRCNERSLAFFEAVLEEPFEGRDFADQDVVNELLIQGMPPVRWTLFPRQFFQVKLGPVPGDIALHHACATPKPYIRDGRKISTMELKVKQLSSIRKFAESSFLQRTAARITARLLRKIRHIGSALKTFRPFSR